MELILGILLCVSIAAGVVVCVAFALLPFMVWACILHLREISGYLRKMSEH